MNGEKLVIDGRFRSPPQSGNGGCVAGLLARRIGGVVRVTLREPPPLEVLLSLRGTDGSGLELRHDGHVVAEAERAALEMDLRACAGHDGA